MKSLNTLLNVFGIEFAESSYSGYLQVGNENIWIESGSFIHKFPARGYLFTAKVSSDLSVVNHEEEYEERLPFLGVLNVNELSMSNSSGRILVFGDSYCVE